MSVAFSNLEVENPDTEFLKGWFLKELQNTWNVSVEYKRGGWIEITAILKYKKIFLWFYGVENYTQPFTISVSFVIAKYSL